MPENVKSVRIMNTYNARISCVTWQCCEAESRHSIGLSFYMLLKRTESYMAAPRYFSVLLYILYRNHMTGYACQRTYRFF